MTSTTDTAGHPDVAEISDLTEGLLPPSRTAEVRRHLDDCELCADVHASLEEIRGLLGTLPGPAAHARRRRRPDRRRARRGGSPGRRATGGAHVSPVRSDTSADSDPARRQRRMFHVKHRATADRPAGRAATSTTGPGRKEPQRSGRRRTVVLGTVFTVAALGSRVSAAVIAGRRQAVRTAAAPGHRRGHLLRGQAREAGLRSPRREPAERRRLPLAGQPRRGIGARHQTRPRSLRRSRPWSPPASAKASAATTRPLADRERHLQGHGRAPRRAARRRRQHPGHRLHHGRDLRGHESPSATAKVLLKQSYTRS